MESESEGAGGACKLEFLSPISLVLRPPLNLGEAEQRPQFIPSPVALENFTAPRFTYAGS